MEMPSKNAAFEGWHCVRLLGKGAAGSGRPDTFSRWFQGGTDVANTVDYKINKPRRIYLAALGLRRQLGLTLVPAPELLAAACGQRDRVPCGGCCFVDR